MPSWCSRPRPSGGAQLNSRELATAALFHRSVRTGVGTCQRRIGLPWLEPLECVGHGFSSNAAHPLLGHTGGYTLYPRQPSAYWAAVLLCASVGLLQLTPAQVVAELFIQPSQSATSLLVLRWPAAVARHCTVGPSL